MGVGYPAGRTARGSGQETESIAETEEWESYVNDKIQRGLEAVRAAIRLRGDRCISGACFISGCESASLCSFYLSIYRRSYGEYVRLRYSSVLGFGCIVWHSIAHSICICIACVDGRMDGVGWFGGYLSCLLAACFNIIPHFSSSLIPCIWVGWVPICACFPVTELKTTRGEAYTRVEVPFDFGNSNSPNTR